MNYRKKYEEWINDTFFSENIRNELSALTDQKEIEDRFYCDLQFGTGGLRGIMGAGTNRMNQYTVGRTTVGLGKYLLDIYGEENCYKRGVVVGYDTRNNSVFFSQVVANVLSGLGIRVYLHSHARPTPQLSFSVTFWNAIAGVVITASHNPREYNGYKIYDEHGCQIVPELARRVMDYVDAVKDYHIIDFAGNAALIFMADVTDNFIMAVIKQSRYCEQKAKADLKVIYTPLHGTGNIPVQKVLRLDGFSQVEAVPEQVVPDGDFPTVISPNPEDYRAFELGIAQAKRTGADIVLGTDPDCDRVGVAVKMPNGEFQRMTGNQIGALLMEFILDNTDLSKISHPAVIKTIVTSELGAEIARKKGVTVFSTLTGFKYIGEKIVQFEQAKEKAIEKESFDFVMGYEESFGYLVGNHAKDKDAVVASLLICEMAAKAKKEGKTLINKIEEIYQEYGYYFDALDTFNLGGKEGTEKISFMMDRLRIKGSLFSGTRSVIDYKMSVNTRQGFGALPASDVLQYILEDGSWVAVRPSGTEPQIKIYYSIKGKDKDEAEKRFENIQTIMKHQLEL